MWSHLSPLKCAEVTGVVQAPMTLLWLVDNGKSKLLFGVLLGHFDVSRVTDSEPLDSLLPIVAHMLHVSDTRCNEAYAVLILPGFDWAAIMYFNKIFTNF